MSAALAALVTVLAGAAGMAAAEDATVFEGFVYGYTQGIPVATPGSAQEHLYETGPSIDGTCTRTVTFSYDATIGDVFLNEPIHDATGIWFYENFVTAGKDYLTHLYLFVFDASGNRIDGNAFIEDDSWETPSATPGLSPQMKVTASVTGSCGEWAFVVDAHRGASEYTVTIE